MDDIDAERAAERAAWDKEKAGLEKKLEMSEETTEVYKRENSKLKSRIKVLEGAEKDNIEWQRIAHGYEAEKKIAQDKLQGLEADKQLAESKVQELESAKSSLEIELRKTKRMWASDYEWRMHWHNEWRRQRDKKEELEQVLQEENEEIAELKAPAEAYRKIVEIVNRDRNKAETLQP